MAKTPKQKQQVWKPFFTLLKKTKLPYPAILVATVVTLVFSWLALQFPNATQEIMAGNISDEITRTLLIVLVAQAFVTALRMYVTAWARAKTTLSFRKSMIRKALRLPMPYYDKHMANRLISRTTNDTTVLSDFFASGIPYIPSAIYTLITTLVLLFGYNWRLVVLQLIMIPIVLLVTIYQGRIQFKWNRRIQGRVAELTGYLAEALSNVPLIKVFVKEKREEEKGRENIDELYKTKRSYVIAVGGIYIMTNLQGVVHTILTVVGGAWLVSKGYIDLPIWIAFYLYSNNLLGAITQLFGYWERIKTVQGAAIRMAEIMSEDDECTGGSKAMPSAPQDIRFENVTFRYEEDDILKDVSFTLEKGKMTALVGRSGAGKSTIFGLLERFYTPEEGRITIGDTDIRDIDLKLWRKGLGYVSQENILFNGTIRENLQYGLDREVSEEQMLQACKDADIYDFVTSCEAGLDTPVGENGSKLSSGQRQRLAIANVMLKDPKILLLDEATSNLDAEATANVENALKRLMEGRTTIMVTHDIASAEKADRIIVLDAGTVAGIGTEAELKTNCPQYLHLKTILDAAAPAKLQ